MLYEVELLVRGGGPEIWAVVGERLPAGIALRVDDRDRRLLAEGRVGDHDLRQRIRRVPQRVVGGDRRLEPVAAVRADAVQIEVHAAQPRDVGDELHTSQRVEAEMPLLIAIQIAAAL